MTGHDLVRPFDHLIYNLSEMFEYKYIPENIFQLDTKQIYKIHGGFTYNALPFY